MRGGHEVSQSDQRQASRQAAQGSRPQDSISISVKDRLVQLAGHTLAGWNPSGATEPPCLPCPVSASGPKAQGPAEGKSLVLQGVPSKPAPCRQLGQCPGPSHSARPPGPRCLASSKPETPCLGPCLGTQTCPGLSLPPCLAFPLPFSKTQKYLCRGSRPSVRPAPGSPGVLQRSLRVTSGIKRELERKGWKE